MNARTLRYSLRLAIIIGVLLAAHGISFEATPHWIELRSAHFMVVTNAGEHDARLLAKQFEIIRAVFLN